MTLFTPEARWTEAAELPGIPGVAVALAVAAFFVGMLAVAMWPHGRRAKGEIHGTEPGGWKKP